MMHKKTFIYILSALLLILSVHGCSSKANPASPGDNPPPAASTAPGTFTITPTITITFTQGPASPTATATLPEGDAYEDDDIWQDAKNIVPGSSQSHTIHARDDEDWMKFSFIKESTVSVTISGTTNAYLELYQSPDLTNTYFTEGDGVNPPYHSEGFIPAGTYYLKIRQFTYADPFNEINYNVLVEVEPMETDTLTHTVSPTFTLTETEIPEDTSTATETMTPTVTAWPADNYEPDDTSGTARTITSGTNEYHTLPPGGDEDWFKFTLPYYSAVTLFAQSDDQKYDLRMYLYHDYSGTPSYITGVQGSEFETYIITNLAAGDYFLRMFDNNPSNGMFYNLRYVAVHDTATATETITLTSTSTATVTPTKTLGPDIYEDTDDVYTGARSALASPNSELHSVYPANDYDWFVYTTTGEAMSRAFVYFQGSGDETIKLEMYSAAQAPDADVYPYTSTASAWWTGEGWASIGAGVPAGTYYVRISNVYPVQEYSFYKQDTTFTITPTFSITQTFSATPTITVTSTVTTTPGAWTIIAAGTPAASQHSALASNGTDYSWGYTEGYNKVHVNGLALPFSTEYTKMGKRWLAKSAVNDYAVYPFGAGSIYVRSSSDSWAGTLGSSLGNGTQPCIYLDGETPYVAYINSDSSNQVMVKSYASSWSAYGSPNFTPAVATEASRYNTISMDGYNDGSLKLFVAYVDSTDGNRVHVKWKNGGSDWADLGGVVYNYAVAASNIDISVVNSSSVYVVFTGNDYLPVVCKWNGLYWYDLSPPLFACSSRYNSLDAVSENEVYISYLNTETNKAIAAMYNGSGWVYMNTTSGYTSSVTTYPYISKSGATVYSGFMYLGNMLVVKYE